MSLFSQLNRIKEIMLESESNVKIFKSLNSEGIHFNVGDNNKIYGTCSLKDFNHAIDSELFLTFFNTDKFNNENSYYLENLEISPNYRGKGYSHKLLDSCKQESIKNKKKFIIIIVDNDNLVAKNLYKKQGFIKSESNGNKSLYYLKT